MTNVTRWLRDVDDPARMLALGAVALLLATPLSVLYYVSNVAGEPGLLLLLATGAVATGAVVGRLLHPRVALAVAVALLVAGGYGYLQTLPRGLGLLATLDPILRDTFALLTGLSVLRIVNAGAWALAITPAPVFLTTYLAVRRHYVGATAVGGATLGLFVLTGDVGNATALLGVTGAAGAVGFGDLERRSGTLAGAETVAVVLASMVVVTLTVSVIPAGAGGGGGGTGGGSGPATLEASLVNAGDTIQVQGPIELSPEVRFTVTTDGPHYWRVGSYDRYTGDGWVRTGGTNRYRGQLPSPPGNSRTVRQTYEAEDTMQVLPAVWKPRTFQGNIRAQVTDDGSLRPAGTIGPSDRYTIESHIPTTNPGELRRAGTDYPAGVGQRYTQLPASMPDRVGERTARITANANNPYETALVVERWLKNNRAYSLDVSRPDGNIADSFLFGMEAGYCTYFATTMVTMLRTQGIPSRLAVGYTPGERVAEDRWVARGMNAHAWVEVYFPDAGWVRFDPTPAGPREQARQGAIETARANDVQNVDTNETGPGEWTPTPSTPTPSTGDDLSTPEVGNPGRIDPGAARTATGTPDLGGHATSEEEGPALPELPPREQLALGLVVLAGAVAGVRRSGLAGRAYREAWLRYQPRNEPTEDVERAFERLEYLLQRQGYERAPGDTHRQFLAHMDDPRVHRVGELYERARYAGQASPEAADEAVKLVDRLVAERSIMGRLY